MNNRIELAGQRFNNILVIEQVATGNNPRIKCLCDCGKVFTANKSNVRTGKITDCGCISDKRIKHNLTKSGTYVSWLSMKKRCYLPTVDSYKSYGARGIKVCDRWLGEDGFLNFLEDMGPRPEGKTLDRINIELDYCKENCRWATTLEQSENKRTSRFITHNGQTKTLSAWERDLGYKRQEILNRLRYTTFSEAISTPSHFPESDRIASYSRWRVLKAKNKSLI